MINQTSPEVFVAAELNDEDVQECVRLGVKTIVNLRVETEEGFVDHAHRFRELNIQYLNLPMDVNALNTDRADEVTAVVALCTKPVLLFCKSGARAKAMAKASHSTRAKVKIGDDDEEVKGMPEKLANFVKYYTEHKISSLSRVADPVQVNDDIVIGPQPHTEDTLKDLISKFGIKSVINLRSYDEYKHGAYLLQKETEWMKTLGLEYRNVPLPVEQTPSVEDKQKVMKEIQGLPKPVFVHCRRMNRAAVAVGYESKIVSIPVVQGFFDQGTNTAQFVIIDPCSCACAIVDSVMGFDPASSTTDTIEADKIIRFIKDNHLHVEYILETHVHADHMTASQYLKSVFPRAKIGIGSKITVVQKAFTALFNLKTEAVDGSQFDVLFNEGDTFNIGYLNGRVMHTPGHTPACACYVIEDTVFVGDTLFLADMGTARCDFPGGDSETLYRSVVEKLFTLPDQTRMFVGHDYAPGGRSFAWETTVGEQKRANKNLSAATKLEEFVTWRNARDATLAVPRLILPSLQVNLAAGRLPQPEDNGIAYLKLPLNKLARK